VNKERKEANKPEEPDLSGVFGGALNILGLKLDLGKLLSAPEDAAGQLGELRERLKQLGGRELLSDEAWRSGAVSVSGHIRTSGLLGDQEFHIGTLGRPARAQRGRKVEAVEAVEPPVDVFDEEGGVTVIADVPGASMDDLQVKVEGSVLSIESKPGTRRPYAKKIELNSEVDPATVRSTCRNGVLEVYLQKRPAPG